MPAIAPTLSWHHIRDFCEKFAWKDPRTGFLTEGYNPPLSLPEKEIQRVPFTITYITKSDEVETGRCICLKVNRDKHQRLVQYIDSQEIRWVRDYLVMEINGTKFVTRTLSM